MGTKSQFYLIHKSLLDMISYINMIGVICLLWDFFWCNMFYVIGFTVRFLLRLLEKNEEKIHEIIKSEEENSETCSSSISSSANKYEVFGVKDINGFIEEPKAMSFTVRELYLGSEEILETIMASSNEDKVFEPQEEEYWKSKFEFFSANHDMLIDGFDSNIIKDSLIEKESSFISEEEVFLESHSIENNNDVIDSSIVQEEKTKVDHRDEDVIIQSEKTSCDEICEGERKEEQSIGDFEFIKEEKPNTLLRCDIDVEDERVILQSKTSCNEIEQKIGEFEWEHEDVIEQLKCELRKTRFGGLATILEEESEIDGDSLVEEGLSKLRPMKIEYKFGYKERIEEVQKVYKIYAERMRKLDILNNQTMLALGFLQLKHQSKSSTPKHKAIIKSFLVLPHILSHHHNRQNDTSLTLTQDAKLQNDFESVYVGQLCLSWEILRWQRTKFRDLVQNDNVSRKYRHVSSEFQLFQILIQRFIEDESFRGPRVQNYVKNRCVVRTLIQVPMIKDDSAKDKKVVLEEKEGCVSTSESLDKIIEDSMITFWDFVKKDEKSIESKFSMHSVTEACDSKLHVEIRKEFHKKDRKVKDIERSGNCVVKILHRKQQGQGQGGIEEQHELLLALVELRLVSRVLNMSRLSRDQLLWCQQKLNQITFSHKKVHLENSFLLFPC